jgi:hypothetical protein
VSGTKGALINPNKEILYGVLKGHTEPEQN